MPIDPPLPAPRTLGQSRGPLPVLRTPPQGGRGASRSFSGGCQCGTVRFRATEIGDAGFCHCRMCQKAFGNVGAALVTVPVAALTWTRGRPAEFRSSPAVARGFCAACGTPLYMFEDRLPVYDMAMGAFDEPGALPAPDHQVGTESKLAWFGALDILPGKRTDEDRTVEDLTQLKSRQHPDHDTGTWPPEDRP